MTQEKPLSEKDREDLAGLLAAVRRPPLPMRLSEKMTVVEMCRAWFVHMVVAAVILVSAVIGVYKVLERVRKNTEIAAQVAGLPLRMERQERKMRELRPQHRKMWWQVENGYTNKDLRELHISPPEFPEED